MTDPTEMVITGVYAASLVIFVLFFRLQRPVAVDPVSPDESLILPPPMPVGKVPVWFYRPADLLGVALLFLVFSGMSISSLRSTQPAMEALDPGVLLANIGFQFVMAGMVAVFVVWRVGWVTWLGLRWSAWPLALLIAPGAVIAVWAMGIGLQATGYEQWMKSLGVDTVQDTVQVLRDSKDPRVLGLMCFAAVIAAPICEEIVFRGYFYPVLKRFSGAGPAACCSALVFASAHGNLTALPLLAAFALLLVFIYERTGSIWATISVHGCFNAATVLIQLLDRNYHVLDRSQP